MFQGTLLFLDPVEHIVLSASPAVKHGPTPENFQRKTTVNANQDCLLNLKVFSLTVPSPVATSSYRRETVKLDAPDAKRYSCDSDAVISPALRSLLVPFPDQTISGITMTCESPRGCNGLDDNREVKKPPRMISKFLYSPFHSHRTGV